MVAGMGMTGASTASNMAPAGVFAGTAVGGTLAWAVAADDQRIRYETFGAGEPALVFVHGGMCDRSYWWAQTAGFASEYRVIALDLPGHGESDKGRSQWSMEGFGDDVARTVQAARADRVILIGHSMGGPVVIEAARRLGSSVIGVVIVDMLHKPSLKPPKPPQLDRDALVAMMRKGMFTPSSDPAMQSRIIDSMTSTPPQIAGALREAMQAYDAPTGLRAIASTPLTMILSEQRPVDAVEIRSLHPRARILVVPCAGHFLMIEAPSSFNTVLRTEALMMAGGVKIL